METAPEGTAQTYIFLVDNQDIALNIVLSGYQALCLVQEDDGYYFSADSFIEEMKNIQFHGSCQSAYHYVVACTVKWMNDKILAFFKDAGLDGKVGWQLFKEKEYLGKLYNQKDVEKLLEQYRDQVQSGVIKRIYNLLITQPKVHREAYELNKQPVRWINFKNGDYDPVTGEMLEHNPDYLTINQIPFPYYPEEREKVLQSGENIKKYLASSLPNKEEQQTFWEYFGYCMTQDTRFQKFLTLKGNGGTGKSVEVSLIQHVVGITNMSSISLQDLNKRFHATGMYGRLLNACADISCKAMENTDVLKKAVGEDTLIYEKKGQDAIHFHSYAKPLFSTNEMPQNLEDKSDAFYRRLLILDMNRVVKSGEKDLHLKEKIQAESDYAIHMAMIALKELYEQGKFTESERSKECVREVQRLSDSICAFIDESLVRVKGKRLKRSEVFNMYEEYCKENGRQGHGKSNFFKNMIDKGFLLKQYNGEFYYQDIAVKEEDFYTVDPEEKVPFESNAFAILTGNGGLHVATQCGVFKGTTKAVFVDRREYAGPLWEQIDEAFQFVLRNIHLGATIVGIYRQDIYEIPPDAIRELIINAMVHRSYLDHGTIQVAVYDNRLEITSPGKLPMGQTMERMKEGYSKIRNEALAHALAYMNLIEHWGSGIPRIIDKVKAAGLREPEFIGGEVDLRINIYRGQVAPNDLNDLNNANKVPDTTEGLPDTTDKVPDTMEKMPDSSNGVPDTTEEVPDNEQEQQIYKYVSENGYITTAETVSF